MYQDAIDIKAFYDLPLGRITARLIRQQIAGIWPDIRGLDVMGLGYATPYLDVYRSRASHLLNIMPAAQGVMAWPRRSNLTVLAHEDSLPLADAALDRVLMVHILEHSKRRRLLREVWRVLAPGGRVIIVVPNRLGFWTRLDRTPFGHGEPFSLMQLQNLLRETLFVPRTMTSALHLPPFQRRSLRALMPSLENTGKRWWGNLSGVLIIEAEKQLYAAEPDAKARARTRAAKRKNVFVEG